MPTAALVTLHRVKNYGSVLQTYATQVVLGRLGYESSVVDYLRPDLVDPAGFYARRSRFSSNAATRAVYRAYWHRHHSRNETIFSGFLERRVHVGGTMYRSIDELRHDPPLADVYVVGSDQVWNDNYNVGGSEPYFLDFGLASTPRIAYSSSFGKQELTPGEVALVKRFLPGFHGVSVRESSAVPILGALGVEATHVLDPTLMLRRDDWAELGLPRLRDEPYLLVYQLNRSAEFDAVVDAAARRFNLQVIRLTVRGERPWIGRGEIRQPEVEDYVSLFAHADYVVTDSFHGTAFSHNLGRPVAVVNPPRYAERLQDFLRFVGSNDRNATPDRVPDLDVDWDTVAQRLDKARDDSRSWLAQTLATAESFRG